MRDQIIKVLEKNKGFNFYQSFEYKDETLSKGIRIAEKRKFIDIEDIKDKKILDLGASTGSESIWALDKGAKSVTSIEKEEIQSSIINDFILEFKKGNIDVDFKHYKHDLNEGLPEEIKKESFDTVFCFAILQYIKYKKIWEDLKYVKSVYLETGADAHLSEEYLSSEVFKAEKISIIKENMNGKNYERAFYKIKRK
jgi:16S rRNA G966 N2-methylase RsmD